MTKLLIVLFAWSAFAAPNTPLPLSAANFFQPIRESFQRNPEWPDHLTFLYNKIMSDTFRAELIAHPWRIVCECDGRPLAADYLRSLELLDGYYHSGVEFRYDERISYRTTFLYRDSKAQRDETEQDITSPYRVISYSNEWYTIRYGKPLQSDDPKAGLNDADIQPVRVQETNEIVLEIYNNHTGPKEVCPNGHKMHYIMVPVSEATM